MQIDDVVWRLSTILRKARSIKNYFARINHIPQETLALAATFLAEERDLLNATAVCQHWRATLLSFPRLWRNPGGSTSELEAYLERSRVVPIEVDLSSPQLAVSIIPHTSRLAALTVHVVDSPGFEEITEHLHDPIPTLRSLEICKLDPWHLLELTSGLDEGLFRHLNTLTSNTLLSFHGPRVFPHITELFLSMSASLRGPAIILLSGSGVSHPFDQAVACICWLEPEDQVALAVEGFIVILEVTTGRTLHTCFVGGSLRRIAFSARQHNLAILSVQEAEGRIGTMDTRTGSFLASPHTLHNVSSRLEKRGASSLCNERWQSLLLRSHDFIRLGTPPDPPRDNPFHGPPERW